MYSNRIQPSDNGPAIYRYLVSNALIAAFEAIEDEQLFGARTELCITAAWPIITRKDFVAWDKAVAGFMQDLYGRQLKPGESIPKMVRHHQLREIILRCRKTGVLDYKERDTSDGTEYFASKTTEEE